MRRLYRFPISPASDGFGGCALEASLQETSVFTRGPRDFLADASGTSPPPLAGFSRDGEYGWTCFGSTVQVFAQPSHELCASISLAPIPSIDSIVDVGSGVLLALARDGDESILVLLSLARSCALAAITVPHEVTVATPIVGDFKGITNPIALGTRTGRTLIVDLKAADYTRSSSTSWVYGSPCKEIRPRGTPSSPGIHAYIELGGEAHRSDGLHFKTHKGTVEVVREKRAVSCITWMPEQQLLLVGFRFGGVIVWSPLRETPRHSFRQEHPVAHLASMCPSTDAKYTYVFLGASDRLLCETRAHLDLFQCSNDNSGLLRSFSTVLGFAHEDSDEETEAGAKRASASSIVAFDVVSQTLRHFDDESSEDVTHQLLAITWMAAFKGKQQALTGLLDPEQWLSLNYPQNIHEDADSDFVPYFTVHHVSALPLPGSMWFVPSSLQEYTAPLAYEADTGMVEKRSPWPARWSLQAKFITRSGFAHVRFVSFQERILEHLSNATVELLESSESAEFVVRQCVTAGLLPAHAVNEPAISGILTVLLGNGYLSAITGLINSMPVVCKSEQSPDSEEIVIGYSDFFEWVVNTTSSCIDSKNQFWEIISQERGLTDKISLFHFAYFDMLRAIRSIYPLFLKTALGKDCTEKTRTTLELHWLTIQREFAHMEVIQWLVAKRILSNQSNSEAIKSAFDGAHDLHHSYKIRRVRRKNLSADIEQVGPLFVDLLWGNDREPYPSRDFPTLVDKFCQDGMEATQLAWLMFYFLLDLDDIESKINARRSTRLAHDFAAEFHISPNVENTLLAFWCLDHAFDNVDGGAELLEDPSATLESAAALLDEAISLLANGREIIPHQHGRVLRALCATRIPDCALRYWRAKSSPAVTTEDAAIVVDIFVANRLPEEAFEFLRRYKDAGVRSKLLKQFFARSEDAKALTSLLSLPFDSEESAEFEAYLRKAPREKSELKELLILYYLQRSRVVEAAILSRELATSGIHSGRSAVLEALVTSHLNLLPRCKRDLVLSGVDLSYSSFDVPIAGASAMNTGDGLSPQPKALRQMLVLGVKDIRKRGQHLAAPAQELASAIQSVVAFDKAASQDGSPAVNLASHKDTAASVASAPFVRPPVTPLRKASGRAVLGSAADVSLYSLRPSPEKKVFDISLLDGVSSPLSSPGPLSGVNAMFSEYDSPISDTSRVQLRQGSSTPVHTSSMIPNTPRSILKGSTKKGNRSVHVSSHVSFHGIPAAPSLEEQENAAAKKRVPMDTISLSAFTAGSGTSSVSSGSSYSGGSSLSSIPSSASLNASRVFEDADSTAEGEVFLSYSVPPSAQKAVSSAHNISVASMDSTDSEITFRDESFIKSAQRKPVESRLTAPSSSSSSSASSSVPSFSASASRPLLAARPAGLGVPASGTAAPQSSAASSSSSSSIGAGSAPSFSLRHEDGSLKTPPRRGATRPLVAAVLPPPSPAQAGSSGGLLFAGIQSRAQEKSETLAKPPSQSFDAAEDMDSSAADTSHGSYQPSASFSSRAESTALFADSLGGPLASSPLVNRSPLHGGSLFGNSSPLQSAASSRDVPMPSMSGASTSLAYFSSPAPMAADPPRAGASSMSTSIASFGASSSVGSSVSSMDVGHSSSDSPLSADPMRRTSIHGSLLKNQFLNRSSPLRRSETVPGEKTEAFAPPLPSNLSLFPSIPIPLPSPAAPPPAELDIIPEAPRTPERPPPSLVRVTPVNASPSKPPSLHSSPLVAPTVRDHVVAPEMEPEPMEDEGESEDQSPILQPIITRASLRPRSSATSPLAWGSGSLDDSTGSNSGVSLISPHPNTRRGIRTPSASMRVRTLQARTADAAASSHSLDVPSHGMQLRERKGKGGK